MALLLLPACAALLLSACGTSSSSSGDATQLLQQTFSGAHKVNSGDLQFTLSMTPSGSSTLTQPVSVGFSGPFQSLGKGKLPASNFTVSISAQGHSGALSILSTGTKGYVTLSGVSYQLPASSFQRLESSFSSIASSGGGGSSTRGGTLAKLGINPLGWLKNPSVVGTENVGGAPTTHIRAQVNVTALLHDLGTFVHKASALGVSGASQLPSSFSAAQQQKIAGEVKSPRFDVWTGSQDKTVRRLSVGLTLPVHGQMSALLGGLHAAGINLTLQYTHLNQPQTITAPSRVEPYSIFQTRLNTLLQEVQSGLAASGLGSATGSSSSSGSSAAGSTAGATGTSTTGSSSLAGATAAYSQCVQKAGQDLSKMQKCASLLSGSGG